MVKTSLLLASCDGSWVKTSFYSLNEEELRSKLTSLENRLYTSVIPMGGDPEYYTCEAE